MYVLAGGRLQFILRTKTGLREASGSLNSKNVCTIIGDAYLHGIMDGKAVRKIDEGNESFQTFKL
ncbi:hypothetical protein F4679DRAFT_565561, partial [Xylaria curta]